MSELGMAFNSYIYINGNRTTGIIADIKLCIDTGNEAEEDIYEEDVGY